MYVALAVNVALAVDVAVLEGVGVIDGVYVSVGVAVEVNVLVAVREGFRGAVAVSVASKIDCPFSADDVAAIVAGGVTRSVAAKVTVNVALGVDVFGKSSENVGLGVALDVAVFGRSSENVAVGRTATRVTAAVEAGVTVIIIGIGVMVADATGGLIIGVTVTRGEFADAVTGTTVAEAA